MIRIAVLCLLLTGCGGLRQINIGAQVPIYVGSQVAVQAKWNDGPVPRGLVAMYDREAKVIYVTWSPDPVTFAERLDNEKSHLADDCGGHWQAAYLTRGGGYDATCADAPAQARAMWAAQDAARAAK